MASYIIKTPEGREVFLLNVRGIDADLGERVTVQKADTIIHGTITRKYSERNRPANTRRGRR